jgi:putative ABC transport system permease protein
VSGFRGLVLRSLWHYRRQGAAVVLGVAAAVSVLAGALVLGDSVRGSLRDLAVGRLGRADVSVSASRFFRESLAEDLKPRFDAASPIVSLPGIVDVEGGARAGGVRVYGVDQRLGALQGRDFALAGREALVGGPLARELGLAPGATFLVRVEAGGAIPGASLFGRRDEPARTLRVTLKAVLPDALGEFSLLPGQRPVLAVFLPLKLLQRALKVEGRVNTLLLSGRGSAEDAAAALQAAARLEDEGLRLRPIQSALSLESETALLDDTTLRSARDAAQALGLKATAVLTYLANGIRIGERSVAYSVVTALEDEDWKAVGDASAHAEPPPVVLGTWAAEDLLARPGQDVDLEYYVWEEEGRLATRTTRFRLQGVVPMRGLAADRDLAPEYPGITSSAHLSDWDPPFPVDLSRVRPKDESYWEAYRTTPKAFVPMAVGRRLWGSRLGSATSMRIEATDPAVRSALEASLGRALDPLRRGFAVDPVRRRALEASLGSTDFGEYFAYFSFFLVAAAVLLAGLFFRLGVEGRARQVGLLRAVGFTERDVRVLLVAEGLALATAGALLGLLGAWGYASLMLHGLRTWWVGAVGTSALAVHVTPGALAAGALGGIASAVLAVVLTLKDVVRAPARELLQGGGGEGRAVASRLARPLGLASLSVAAVLLVVAAAGELPRALGFFGAGTFCLLGGLLLLRAALGGGGIAFAHGVAGLGQRNAARRPGRSLLSIALVASATFLIVSMGAFRRNAADEGLDRRSGAGGYALVAESLLPLHHDPGSAEGRAALGLDAPRGALDGVGFARFRVRAGDDLSCLNLYRPKAPRILGAPPAFLHEGRFAFQASLAATPEEKENPWRLLERPDPSGAIPVIADANSLEYVLHLKLGDELSAERPGREPLRLRVVGALADSLFQSELVMAEAELLRAFPDEDGYRFFLVEAPGEKTVAVASFLESHLRDLGFDAATTSERLARFHQVENTYLSTFQALGALGLVLGTLGLGAVLLRNALERRRELALLRAVGYREADVTTLVLAENLLLLCLGLGLGGASALLAVTPALHERGSGIPVLGTLGLLLLVFAAGLLASRAAVAVVHRSTLLDSLRSE